MMSNPMDLIRPGARSAPRRPQSDPHEHMEYHHAPPPSSNLFRDDERNEIVSTTSSSGGESAERKIRWIIIV